MIPSITTPAGRSVRIHKQKVLVLVVAVYLGYVGISFWWHSLPWPGFGRIFSWSRASSVPSITFKDCDQFLHNEAVVRPYLDHVVAGSCEGGHSAGIDPQVWQKYCEDPSQVNDPRLAIAIWVYTLTKHLTQFGSLNGFRLPFSWNLTLALETRAYSDCFQLFRQLDLNIPPQNISYYCTLNADSLVQLSPIDFKASEESFRILNQIYLAESMPVPDRVIFSIDNSSVIVPTEQGDNISYSSMNYPGVVKALSNQISTLKAKSEEFPLFDSPRIVSKPFNSTIKLSKQDFMFDFQGFFLILRSRNQFVPNTFDQKLMDSLIGAISSEPENLKYFHEPKLFSKGGGHFDWRFFKRLQYSDYERINILNRISKSWLKFSNSIGLKTWLAHGTLLGWYWNGLNLPWDNDLDIQMTIESLIKLARNYNNSIIVDLDNQNQFGKYYLDINPNFYQRSKENGNNVIDGRFIDIETGFYIDITALSFSHLSKYVSILNKELVEFNQLLDPEYLNNEESHTVVKSTYHKLLFNERAKLINQQLIYNCKNNHYYKLAELDPLQLTQFEGLMGYVPHEFKDILSREYPKGLYYKSFNKHCYNPKLRLWVKCKTCSSDDDCKDQDMMVFYNLTKEFTSTHKHNMYYKSRTPRDKSTQFYIDPWLINQLQKIIN